jgi:hypothetical protein
MIILCSADPENGHAVFARLKLDFAKEVLSVFHAGLHSYQLFAH